ncbi:MAG: alpha/beta hydrolase [Chlamydiae bacterium]|nr:alpha/beta hydrolase [Chlamydiota bacterium]
MPHVHANGINMYYEVHGEGKPLILIQGFTRNTLNWRYVLDLLKGKYQVILIDNRGSGRTQHPSPPYSMQMMAKDIAELLQTIGIETGFFVGHSMGGAILQQLCIDYPKMVKKAIICSSFAQVPYTSLMQIDSISQMAVGGVAPEFIFQSVLPGLFSSQFLSQNGNTEKVIQQMLHDPYPQQTEGFLGQAEALKNFNITNELGRIECPCLILVGENDLFTPVSYSKLLKEKIKMAHMKIIPQQGHMINEEVPDQLSKEIEAFFSC